jgi:hypothetical protein
MLVTIFSLLVSVNAAYAQNLLRSPQKIVIDQARDRLLVSNFDGGGSLVHIDADGNQDYVVMGATLSILSIVSISWPLGCCLEH